MSTNLFSVFFLIGIAVAIGSAMFFFRYAKKKKSKVMKQMAITYTTLLGVFIAVFLIIQSTIAGYCMNIKDVNELEKFDYMIVLGAGLKGDQVSERLKGRLDEALKYYQKNKEVVVIVSGGKGGDELISEAEAMEKYLIKNGVDNRQIIKEPLSTSTTENLRYSREILKVEEALDKKILIVTSDYHSYRAHFIANQLGIKNESLVARNPFLVRTNYMIREGVALIKDYIAMKAEYDSLKE